MSFDHAHVNSEFERLAKAFEEGAAACSPSLPLTALVVQVLASCHDFILQSERFISPQLTKLSGRSDSHKNGVK